MHKPRYLLYLPAGALTRMRPFRRWVNEQPTCQVVLDTGAGPGYDLVEFYSFVCSRHLQEAIPRLLRPHTPFQLLLNLAQPLGPERRILFVRQTHQGVVEQQRCWHEVTPVPAEYWRSEFLGQPGRFALFRELAPRYLSPAEYRACLPDAQL